MMIAVCVGRNSRIEFCNNCRVSHALISRNNHAYLGACINYLARCNVSARMLGYRADVVKGMPITCPRRGDRALKLFEAATGISLRYHHEKTKKSTTTPWRRAKESKLANRRG